jgi:hypothetical protein
MVHRATHVTSDVVSAIEEAVAAGADAANDPRVRAFMNLHPGLELEKVFEESAEAPVVIGKLKERVGWVERAHALNPDLDLLAVDFMPDSADLDKVKFDGLSEETRSLVIANFKSYQRMQGAGAGALAGFELMKAGYRSATALARSSPEEIATRSGLPVTEARGYFTLARQKADETALTWFALFDMERDSRIIGHKAFLQPPAPLKRLKGYNDLFGSLDFCSCEQCRSVLGPAAYFVDLMFYVAQHVLLHSFEAHGGAEHPLHLRSRRPDLWDRLELTCENTTKIVPTLELVIELLERFIVDQ